MKAVVLIINDITKIGGTERAVVSLANIIKELGYHVTILNIVSPEFQKASFLLNSEVKVETLQMEIVSPSFFLKIRWNIIFKKKLSNYFRRNKFDFIIGTGHYVNWLLPFLKENLVSNGKIIACEHIVYESLPEISRLLMSLTYNKLDHLVVLSEIAKRSYCRYTNVTVIPNSLPFSSDRVSPLTSKQILIVGRISHVKGLERLVDIISKLVDKKDFDWRIKIVGEGEEKENLARLYRENGIDQYVEFVPFTQNVSKEYYESSIYIMTSHFEAFPMVLLEAKSMGLPIVAFDCPEGPKEIIIEGVDGFLIENGNSAMFAQAIERLINDRELRQLMGKNATEDSKKYQKENIANHWSLLLR